MQKRKYTLSADGYLAIAAARHKERGTGGTYSHLSPEQRKAYHRRAAARQYQRDRAKRKAWQASLTAPAEPAEPMPIATTPEQPERVETGICPHS